MSIKAEAYQQNYLQFRSLNQIMWQVPVLAMTLTGGLWFGVSKILDNPLLVTVVLLTATAGNLAFMAILWRFRHVMDCYLDWLKKADLDSFVDASANKDSSSRFERFVNQNKTVSILFSGMLAWAAFFSTVLLVGYWISYTSKQDMNSSQIAIDYYDRYAAELADSYESVSFEQAYPFLLNRLQTGSLNIVDVGAGTGRDAAWLADAGHRVVAVEPSASMRTLASNLHAHRRISWVAARLPNLDDIALPDGSFDLALVNAVWMHVVPEQREEALARLYKLVKPSGSAIVSLRMGPADQDRGMFTVDPSVFVLQAEAAGFSVIPQGDFRDVLGRPEVSWKAFELKRPS